MKHQQLKSAMPQRLGSLARSKARAAGIAVALGGWAALSWSCAGAGQTTGSGASAHVPPHAPQVAAEPGAWFDARGNLTVVGPGRRLRLVLSAPISACGAALDGASSAAELAERASLPFHVFSEACRETRPAILLAAENDTASPSELERSYHEVAQCAAVDYGVTDGWIPSLVRDVDPCPLALGLGWRLPTAIELSGLTLDDRKAIAGALFDTADRSAFGSLLLYARAENGSLELATLSPNASDRPAELTRDKLAKPFFGVAVRCVRDSGPAPDVHAALPVLPHAAECLRAQRQSRGPIAVRPIRAPTPELQRLRAWVELAQRTPALLRGETGLQELAQILAAPALEELGAAAREERALTERYAELADGLDDASVSASERERRRAEFDSLRRRLGGRIVRNSVGSANEHTELAAVLTHLGNLLEKNAAQAKAGKKGKGLDYAPLVKRVAQLAQGGGPGP